MKLLPRMTTTSWIIFIGFITLAIVDLISTLTVGELVQYMETNPTYIIFGWVGLILANTIAIYCLLMAYSSKNIANRYAVITTFVYLSVVRVFVIINNFSLGSKVQAGEITRAMVESTSDAVKVNHHLWMIVLNILAPLIFSMVIYFLFSLDHKIEDKND